MFLLLLGIDVGGTFTDAVLIKDDVVFASVKTKTIHDNITLSVLSALDELINSCGDITIVSRVALSTTIITNAIVTGKVAKVSLVVVPGPGYNVSNAFPTPPFIVDGYTDHRGKAVWTLDTSDIIFDNLEQNVAVSAKFSVRNPESEYMLKKIIEEKTSASIVLGHDMSGYLGFIRRTNSAYFTAATTGLFKKFKASILDALKTRAITAPLFFLKADGATMPGEWAENHSVEAYFTGPAASVMGIRSLLSPKKRAISLDIGGTTTDIALWEDGAPVMSQRGAFIDGYPTSVRALNLRSVAVGGDSVLKKTGEIFSVGPERLDFAMALGGKFPTVTDAFVVLGYGDFGDVAKAKEAMLLLDDKQTPETTAKKVMDIVIEKINKAIEEMLRDYALRPVYKVKDIVNEKSFTPEILIGVGGAAVGIVPYLSETLNLPFEVPQNAFVANAIGAAVARSTLTATLRADTTEKKATVVETDMDFSVSTGFTLENAKLMLFDCLKEEAMKNDIDFDGTEVIWAEEFPVVRGGYNMGRVINLSMELKPGVKVYVKGGDSDE